MTRILILGATGRTGTAVLENLPADVTTIAALRTPHDVHRLSSPGNAITHVTVDITDLDSLRNALNDVTVVVNAVRLRGDIHESELIDLHERIVTAGEQAGGGSPRIVTVGGAGALRLPEGRRFWESPAFPQATLPRGRAHAALRDHLETVHAEDAWTYLIPPPTYDPDGTATGRWERFAPSSDESAFTTRAISYADVGAAVTDATINGGESTHLVAWHSSMRFA